MTIKPQPLTFRFLGMTFNVPTFFDWAAALFAGAVVLVLLSWIKPTPLIPANYTVVIVASVLTACGVSLLNWRNWKHMLFFLGAILSVGFITQIVWPHF